MFMTVRMHDVLPTPGNFFYCGYIAMLLYLCRVCNGAGFLRGCVPEGEGREMVEGGQRGVGEGRQGRKRLHVPNGFVTS